MTCYDLRFPELARALVDRGAELLVVPAAWVAGPRKVDHWRTLLKARAIENTVYVAAAAQPGPRYTGHSMVVSPWGEVLEAQDGDLFVESTVERAYLDDVRAENTSLANRRF
jgi:predicted amidohydrolase